jgi:hypothetical protein
MCLDADDNDAKDFKRPEEVSIKVLGLTNQESSNSVTPTDHGPAGSFASLS